MYHLGISLSSSYKKTSAGVHGQPFQEMKPRYLIPVMLFALPVAYLISTGPVMALNARYNHGDEPSWGRIYSPVFWVCDHSQLFTSAMQWYLEKWMPAVEHSN